MAQLTALDAGFLKSRDPERHPGLAIGAVAVVNGAAPSYDQLKTVLTERIKSIPRCTQVLATEWIDYPGFDLTQHVRRVALPRPGDEAELFRAIALALERPLDPDRPLWECWIIEGLNGNRWAILIKIHHCMAGAMSAAHLLARLCDDADGSAFANNVISNRFRRMAMRGAGPKRCGECPSASLAPSARPRHAPSAGRQ